MTRLLQATLTSILRPNVGTAETMVSLDPFHPYVSESDEVSRPVLEERSSIGGLRHHDRESCHTSYGRAVVGQPY